jgi:hypothetical protein
MSITPERREELYQKAFDDDIKERERKELSASIMEDLELKNDLDE